MACLACVRAQGNPYDDSYDWVSGPTDKSDPHNLDAWRALRTSLYYQTVGRTAYGRARHQYAEGITHNFVCAACTMTVILFGAALVHWIGCL